MHNPVRPSRQLADQLSGSRAVLPDGRTRDGRFRRRRGPGIPGEFFAEGYVFPMRRLPLSYLDKMVAKGINGTKVELDGKSYELKVRSFPQARNGIPNPDYDGGKGYVPVGAVSTSQVEEGGRCQGNDNCVPICPVQAKYNAGKTLAKALQTGRVDLLAQSVASKIHIDPDSGRVSHIEFKTYHDRVSPDHTTGTVRGRIFVLSANAIENPRLMLASGLPSTSGLVGRNLMDHAYLLSWALMPVVCGTMRGTNCTGGITALRGGSFRRKQAAFSVDIHNDGWGWAVGSPYSDLERAGRYAEQVWPGAAARFGRPDHTPVAASLHDRGAAEPEQSGQRRPGLQRPAWQYAPRDFLHHPRIHDAGSGLRASVRPHHVPAPRRCRLHRVRPHRLWLRDLRGRRLRHPGRKPPGWNTCDGHEQEQLGGESRPALVGP